MIPSPKTGDSTINALAYNASRYMYEITICMFANRVYNVTAIQLEIRQAPYRKKEAVEKE